MKNFLYAMFAICVLVWLFTPSTSRGDAFDDYALQHNTRSPLSILVGEAQRLYEKYDQTGIIKFSERRWLDNVGLARYTLVDGYKTEGWMAFQLNSRGKVHSMIWVEGNPKPQQARAFSGQLADTTTTLGFLSRGIAEANPIADIVGVPGLIVAKTGMAYYLTTKSLGSCVEAERGLTGFGWGAATWNIAAIIAGAAVPAAIVPAIAIAVLSTPSVEEAVWACIPKPLVAWASQ